MGASPLQDPPTGRAVHLPTEASPPLAAPGSAIAPAARGDGTLRLGRPRDWAIGGTLLVALVAIVHYTVGWGPLLAPWLAFPPLLIAWLFLLTALSYALRAVRVYDWFRPGAGGAFATGGPGGSAPAARVTDASPPTDVDPPMGRGRPTGLAGQFPSVLRLSVLHNAANNLLPMRTGEMVFPWLMRSYFGYGFLDAAAALLWIRILDMHFLGLIGILILDLRDPRWFWWLAGLAWVGALSLLALISRAGGLPWLAGGGRLRRLVRTIAAAAPREHWLIARVYLWTAGTWTLKFIAFASVLEHFVPAAFWRVMAGVMGAELSSVLPFHGIAGSGSYELAAVAALVPLGIDPRVALAGAVNLHLFVLGTTLLLGGLAFLLPRPGGGICNASGARPIAR